MSLARIASRYAKSLLELGLQHGRLDNVLNDINLLNDVLENRDFFLLVKSPIVKSDKKNKIFKAIFDGKIDDLTQSFYEIIIRKGREKYLPEIAREFIRQYRDHKNITTAKVTTAAPLSEEQTARIKSELIQMGIASGAVELETSVDKDIIGGFLLEVEDQMYDASVRSKLANLKKEILDNTYIKSL